MQTRRHPHAEDDPAFQQSMVEGGGAQRAVVDLLVEQVSVSTEKYNMMYRFFASFLCFNSLTASVAFVGRPYHG